MIAKLFRLYRLAAEQGFAAAQSILGMLYSYGYAGLAKDEREAARLYRLAADQGDANAQLSLATFYRDGLGGLAKDDREAARLYRLAADRGYAIAQSASAPITSRVSAGWRRTERSHPMVSAGRKEREHVCSATPDAAREDMVATRCVPGSSS